MNHVHPTYLPRPLFLVGAVGILRFCHWVNPPEANDRTALATCFHVAIFYVARWVGLVGGTPCFYANSQAFP